MTLKVKKAPLAIRCAMFLFAFACFVLPLSGVVMSIYEGQGFHFGFLIGLFLFGLLGFYLLRLSLWNTYGQETIKFETGSIDYEANYGWFKDGKKQIGYNNLVFYVNKIGYDEDKTGSITIDNREDYIVSVVKMPVSKVENLITELELLLNNHDN
ncbi:hypothetical protein [Aestuariibaculum sediminum]|uniref:Uncharacterized protein n=1 Tax=Aestuariibaculum sediminum TaxID=2770637 RepID=A0A8J6Q9P1_9FLAO|nr:hypothetical protein [Aestuariibaculum sediminum]MBD0831126.1 hypothetical protein [Aestuariibaculum sediminum]